MTKSSTHGATAQSIDDHTGSAADTHPHLLLGVLSKGGLYKGRLSRLEFFLSHGDQTSAQLRVARPHSATCTVATVQLRSRSAPGQQRRHLEGCQAILMFSKLRGSSIRYAMA